MGLLASDSKDALVERCRATGRCNLFYELAPTGNLHLGIVRCLLYAQEVRRALQEAAIEVRFYVRVNDLAAFWKGKPFGDDRLHGRQLRDIRDVAANRSLVDYFVEELCELLSALEIDAEIIFSSAIYRDPHFQDILWSLIEDVASNSGPFGISPSEFVFPRVAGTAKIYNTQVIRADGLYRYKCLETGETGEIDRQLNGGILAFKYESVCFWRFLDVDMDVHAVNHRAVAEKSQALFAEFMFKGPPIAPHLGIIKGEDGRMVSKSKRNFVSVRQLMIEGKLFAVARQLRVIQGAKDLREQRLIHAATGAGSINRVPEGMGRPPSDQNGAS